MTEAARNQVYYVAPFSVDGESQGVGAWQRSSLSPRWLQFCHDIFRSGGEVFHGPLPHPFERVGLRFTSLGSQALVTLSLDGLPVRSSAYLRGGSPTAERQLLEMFVDSVRKAKIVRQCQTSSHPFAAVFGISERPLHAVIVWPGKETKEMEIIRELSTHFAGAFLYGNSAV